MKNAISMFLVMILGISVAFADQPYMKAAKTDLNKALNALNRATADKGGHRERAMGLVNQAITAVNNGIAYDERNPNNRPRRNDFSLDGQVMAPVADQPNMRIAIGHLRDALADLEKATADKGGYRVDAMRLVREAISETQKGIDFDREN